MADNSTNNSQNEKANAEKQLPDINEKLLGETDEAKALKAELEKCLKEKEEYLNGWKRAKADLINYQKDEAKRFEETLKFANREMMGDLLGVLDSFNLAMLSLEKTAAQNAMKGIYMIYSQLESALKKYGLEKMNTTIGKAFDPALEESIGEAISELPEGSVADVVEYGYFYNGRVLRPARVKLAKKNLQK